MEGTEDQNISTENDTDPVSEDGEEIDKVESSSSLASRFYKDSIDFDRSSIRCFKQIELSSSSIFKQPLYYFPELADPGILQAFNFEPPIEIDNDIGREKYIRICKELKIVPFRRILQALDQDYLDLRYFGLRPKEMKALFKVLETNAYVKTLLLGDNIIEEENAHLLSDLLSQNTALSTLDLKQCEIGPKGANALNEGIKTTASLKSLDLSFNTLGDEGISNLSLALRRNTTLLEINLGHNNITFASANTLQRFFSQHECIRDVNLEWNLLANNEAMKKICAGLRSNNSLVSLNLSWNGLETFRVAKELGRFIRESTTLKYIDLSNNYFREKPAMVLKKAFGLSESLQHAKFGWNPVSPDEALLFGNMLLQSESLVKLDMEYIVFPKAVNLVLKKLKTMNKELVIGGILRNFVIKGPNVRHVLLKRCNYLGFAPRRAKAKRDFGHIILSMPEKVMEKQDFERFVRRKKKGKMFDKDLLTEIQIHFPSGKKKVDIQKLVSEYLNLYPDTKLPPPKPKKEKKRKRRKAASSSSQSATTDTENPEYSDVNTERTESTSSKIKKDVPSVLHLTSSAETLPTKSDRSLVQIEEHTEDKTDVQQAEKEIQGVDKVKSTVKIKEDVEEFIIEE